MIMDIVWRQNCGPFGVCQDDVLENLTEENYNSQVLTK